MTRKKIVKKQMEEWHFGKRGILAVMAIVSAMVVTLLSPEINKVLSKNRVSTSSIPSPTNIVTKNTDIFTKDKVGGMTTIKYQGVDGQSVLALLKANGNEVVTEESSFGTYVNSINGIKGGTDSKYWLFYVNEEMPSLGADQYLTTASDTVEWKFE